MFYFAVPYQHEPRTEGLSVVEDIEFAQAVERGWLTETGKLLGADMYPLRNHVTYRWDGSTPNSHDMCRMLVVEGTKVEPDYIWIDGKMRSFRANAPWDTA